MTDLLTQANTLLKGELGLRHHNVRAACWLARTALEDAVRRLVGEKGVDAGDASMRSLLSCLEVLYAADHHHLVMRAEYAWSRLSNIAHHHAYELSPTLWEAQDLIDLVGGLRDGAAAPKLA